MEFNVGSILRCKTCNVERELNFFQTCHVNGKKYYARKKCKVCLGIIPRQKKNDKIGLSKECLEFLDRLRNIQCYVDMLDSFKLAHYFIETFGYIELDFNDIEEELNYMLRKLLEEKKRNEIYE